MKNYGAVTYAWDLDTKIKAKTHPKLRLWIIALNQVFIKHNSLTFKLFQNRRIP